MAQTRTKHMNDTDKQQRHQNRMQRKKEVIDAAI
jgi:hypothetical protein